MSQSAQQNKSKINFGTAINAACLIKLKKINRLIQPSYKQSRLYRKQNEPTNLLSITASGLMSKSAQQSIVDFSHEFPSLNLGPDFFNPLENLQLF